jgi:hypothetical protein
MGMISIRLDDQVPAISSATSGPSAGSPLKGSWICNSGWSAIKSAITGPSLIVPNDIGAFTRRNPRGIDCG